MKFGDLKVIFEVVATILWTRCRRPLSNCYFLRHPDTAGWCQLSNGLFSKTEDLIKSQHDRVNIVDRKDVSSRGLIGFLSVFFLPLCGIWEMVFLQKSAFLAVPRADLHKVHSVVHRRRLSPCLKYLIKP